MGLPTFSVLPSADQIYEDDASRIASDISSSLADYAKNVSTASNGAVQEANVLAALQMQYDLVFKSHVPFAEIVLLPIGHSFSSEYWPLLPFSRGNVHIQSGDSTKPPAINPNYFMFEQDLKAQVSVAKFIRRAFMTAPLKDLVGEEYAPGTEHVSENASDPTWESWIKSHCKYKANTFLGAQHLGNS